MLDALLFASLFTLVVSPAVFLIKVLWKKKPPQTLNVQDELMKAELKKTLWKLFSRYTRSKDADWRGYADCFTCERIDDWRSFDCGHYIPKAICGDVLYFHPKNNHRQCITCNRLKRGNTEEYKARLIKKYGEGVLLELNQLRQAPPFTIADYQREIAKYTQLLKSLN